jgi:hypothetical protein
MIVEHLLACQLTNLPHQTYCDETSASVDYTEKIAKLIPKNLKMTSTGGAATAAGGGVTVIKRGCHDPRTVVTV